MNKTMKIILIFLVIMILVIMMMMGMFIMDRRDDYKVDISDIEIPTYTESSIKFHQGNDNTSSLPFMASAIIDVDNDGVEELFLGGSQNTPDGLFKFKGNKLVAIKGTMGITKDKVASYGSVVLDVNNDGRQDLLVAREDGIWLHINNGGSFDTQKIAIMPEGTVPLSIAIADLNRDGAFDMYVAGYLRHDLTEGQNIFREGYGGSSRLFVNNGNNSFTDMTKESGLEYQHNTFQSAFIDIDRDGREDLIVAEDTGHVQTWQNKGDMKFERVSNSTSKNYSYPMGLGITDLDSDGLVDFYLSNVGSTPPNFMVRGDLADDQVSNWKWILLKNNGDFKLEDIAQKAKIADYEFAWGGVFDDLNLDGKDDLIVSQNYIALMPYKVPFLRLNGRVLLQNSAGEFAPVEKQVGVINREFSISPLTADFNNDGYSDIVHANLNSNSKLFLSKGGKSNYLKVSLPNDIGSITAIVKVELANGNVLSRPYVSGEGLCSDSSHIITFGLGKSSAKNISVEYINGKKDVKSGNFMNVLVKL